MRRVILSMALSLDGFIEAPGGEFVPPPWCEEPDLYSRDMSLASSRGPDGVPRGVDSGPLRSTFR